eukprot:CAMPEP_0176427016 /NCGR_PEP_ID=MMETSP0127-20121128/12282_1 /TAXON_ID=938130 /ORGANISM="Platyophrya macrostoma, Strain WH" /LENGTH=80 /DNA_ID=CAMNT_0017808385 /DNA_START=304 /DNA_END=543 /DNA_ORIENTATION=+
MENGTVLQFIRSALESCGYVVDFRVLDASDVLPQRRRRVFLVGFLTAFWKGASVPFQWPVLEQGISRKRVRDVLEDDSAL